MSLSMVYKNLRTQKLAGNPACAILRLYFPGAPRHLYGLKFSTHPQCTDMTSLIRAYESLLLSNLSSASTLESAIRNITWLLPGRFEDAELASEGRRSNPFCLPSPPFYLSPTDRS